MTNTTLYDPCNVCPIKAKNCRLLQKGKACHRKTEYDKNPTCHICGGTGKDPLKKIVGSNLVEVPCERCNGTGKP